MRPTSLTLQLISTTAITLIIGYGVARAEMGGEARSADRKIEKQLDDRELTPIRPIRRVGSDSWPDAKAAEQQSAQQKKDEATRAANERSTTGQAPKEQPAEQAAQPASQDNKAAKTLASEPPKDNAQKQAAEPPKPDAAKQAAQPEPSKQQAAQPEPNKQAAEQKAEPANQDTAANNGQDKGAASIRLGTDASGKVAINDDQERQISRVIRKQNVRPVDNPGIDIKVGVSVPKTIRLGAVSADLVEVLPQFRGYSFFATRDNVVIVEPSSMKIIALIPVQTGGSVVTTRGAPPAETSRTTVRRETPRTTTRTTTRTTSAAPSLHDVETAIEQDINRRHVIRDTTGSGTVYRSYRMEPQERTVIIERRRGLPFW
jgi:hypothetical protein